MRDIDDMTLEGRQSQLGRAARPSSPAGAARSDAGAAPRGSAGRFGQLNLGGKLLLGLALGLLASSLLFLVVFLGIYRAQLTQERGLATEQVNRLLEVALKNAMLKRDIAGLSDIVDKLGRQPGIASVTIVNPELEVRFASAKEMLGRTLTFADLGCETCAGSSLAGLGKSTRLTMSQGRDVLRSVNPIANQPECRGCHGDIESHPVNGVLVVDQSAESVERAARHLGGLMAGAGSTVVLFALIGAWAFMRRTVVAPVAALQHAATGVASGDLAARVQVPAERRDEIGALGRAFNDMASALESNVGALRDKETFLQSIVDAVPDGLRVINSDYKVVIANAAHAAQLGVEPGSLVGTACYRVRGRDAPCPPTLMTCPFHAIDRDNQRIRFMHELQQKAGELRNVDITASRLEALMDGRKETLVIEVMRDLDEKIKFSHEQRLSEIGQLATGVAHEIYNPLSSVRLGLQALDRSLKRRAEVDAETSEYLATVNSQIDRCIDITRRLLDLGNPPSSNVQLVSFTRIVPEVLSLLRFEAQIKNVDVVIDLGPEDLRMLATDSEMRMLVLNLSQNAFHAMPEGGKLTIRGRVVDDRVTLEVIDTGVGISEADIKRIFDPFFSKRADGSQGSGLGLTLCHAIVTRYHGSLSAASEPGLGTTFTLTLPFAGARETHP